MDPVQLNNPPLPISPIPNVENPVPPTISPTPVLTELPKKKFPLFKVFLIILILFFLLVLVMVTMKIISKPPNPQLSPQPTQNPIESEAPSPTAGWIIYTNNNLGFQVKIPKDWKTETHDEQPNLAWLKASDQSSIEISVTNTTSGSLDDYLSGFDETSKTAWEGKPSKEIIQTKDFLLGEYPAKQRTEKWLAAGFETTATYSLIKGKVFSFTVTPSPSGEARSSNANDNYNLILSTFETAAKVDFSKWKTWNDPNGFTLLYPPNAVATHLNENTTIETRGDNGNFSVSFCKNCVKNACTGTCDNEKDIKIQINGQKYAEKQISPDNIGNFTFRVVISYPNTYTREKLAIFGSYPSEENLTDIDTILSTFKFIEKKTQ